MYTLEQEDASLLVAKSKSHSFQEFAGPPPADVEKRIQDWIASSLGLPFPVRHWLVAEPIALQKDQSYAEAMASGYLIGKVCRCVMCTCLHFVFESLRGNTLTIGDQRIFPRQP